MKAKIAEEVTRFEDIPNIGPAMVRDFKILGIKGPSELAKKDLYQMYQALSKKKGRQDPCVLDTYMAATDFMRGAKAMPWYAYTKERKRKYPNI